MQGVPNMDVGEKQYVIVKQMLARCSSNVTLDLYQFVLMPLEQFSSPACRGCLLPISTQEPNRGALCMRWALTVVATELPLHVCKSLHDQIWLLAPTCRSSIRGVMSR
jgi:hypothetical protein